MGDPPTIPVEERIHARLKKRSDLRLNDVLCLFLVTMATSLVVCMTTPEIYS